MRVLVTGGTGRLGREVVRAAVSTGHAVCVLSRRPRRESDPADVTWAVGDITTGDGLPDAVNDIDAIVHAASDPRGNEAADVEGTRRLSETARAAGVSHVVYVSIVGIHRIPYAYYTRKLEAERMLATSGVPYSILRATQFHSFVSWLLAQAARFPMIMPIPLGFHVQSVATEDVAARLCRALDDGPAGMLRDFAGPEIMPLEAAAQVWSAHRPQGLLKAIVPIYLPGKTAAAFRAGYNTAPDGERGTLTWREWLLRSMDA
jgi:uncharacterized protein YbjT (DUF2867 family)